jgi:hypothetical protein
VLDGLEHLEAAPLLVEGCKAANDLPTGASGGCLLDVGLVDCRPHDGAVQETDPGGQLAAPEGVVGPTDQLVPSSQHLGKRTCP